MWSGGVIHLLAAYRSPHADVVLEDAVHSRSELEIEMLRSKLELRKLAPKLEPGSQWQGPRLPCGQLPGHK